MNTHNGCFLLGPAVFLLGACAPPEPVASATASTGINTGPGLHIPDLQLEDVVPYAQFEESHDDRWPKATVYWMYEEGDDELDSAGKNLFLQAISYISQRTPVRFVKISDPSTVEGHVYIWKNDERVGSRAEVGYEPSSQDIEMGYSSGTPAFSIFLHEVTHTLGMKHEVQRYDRDAFVTVTNIDSDFSDNFDKVNDLDISSPYDYNSIMHYVNGLFAEDPTQPTLIPKQLRCPEDSSTYFNLGQDPAGNYTAQDINALWLMYGRRLIEPDAGDLHGASIEVADFDGDGYDDIAVGAPGRSLFGDGDIQNLGVVLVFKGTGLHPVPWKVLKPFPTVSDESRFGASLAAGDFDGDGQIDLAVGAPGAAAAGDAGSQIPVGDTGAVYVFHGGQFVGADYSGPGSPCIDAPTTPWAPLEPWIRVMPHEASNNTLVADGDEFGFSLDAARLYSALRDSLIIGSPGWSESGAVFIYTGVNDTEETVDGEEITVSRMDSPPEILTYPISKKIRGRFGSTIASADFDRNGDMDLAISDTSFIDGKDPAVYLYRGNGNSTPTLWRNIHAGPSDNGFGTALAFGNLVTNNFSPETSSDATVELAVGAPLDSSGFDAGSGGAVYVYQFVDIDFASTTELQVERIQSIFSPWNQNERFGSALLATNVYARAGDLWRDELDDLFIGAPGMASNTGTVANYSVGENDKRQLSFVHLLPTPLSARLYGSSLAAVRAATRPSYYDSNLGFAGIARVLVGAPLSFATITKTEKDPYYGYELTQTYTSNAGAIYGMSVDPDDQSGPRVFLRLHGGSKSPEARND